jgi:hypothetical protein
MAAGSVQFGGGPWSLGFAGGIYDDDALASGWGSAGIGPMTFQAEILFVDEAAWLVGASYLRPLEDDVFSGIKLISVVRSRGSEGGENPGLEATGGLVLVHRVDEDLDLSSGLSWSAFIPESALGAVSHSAVLDLQLFY